MTQNTIHCINCGNGTDMPSKKWGKQDSYSYEEKVCPFCNHLIEVTVRDRGKVEEL